MDAKVSKDLLRAVRQIEVRTRRLVNENFAGEYHALFKGQGIEFDEVRAYQPGDDVRLIDWNVTARTGEPFVKRFVEERELTVMVAVDASASGYFGTQGRFKQELAAEVASVLAFSAIANNDKVGLLIFTDRIERYIAPRKGRRHVLRLVREVLALDPAGRGTDIGLALNRLNQTLKRRAVIFLLSDFLLPTPPAALSPPISQPVSQPLAQLLAATNRHHDLAPLVVTDAREAGWPNVGLVTVEDLETGREMVVDSGSARWRAAFAARATARIAARNQLFRQARVDYVELQTGQAYVLPLMNFFKARARLRRR